MEGRRSLLQPPNQLPRRCFRPWRRLNPPQSPATMSLRGPLLQSLPPLLQLLCHWVWPLAQPRWRRPGAPTLPSTTFFGTSQACGKLAGRRRPVLPRPLRICCAPLLRPSSCLFERTPRTRLAFPRGTLHLRGLPSREQRPHAMRSSLELALLLPLLQLVWQSPRSCPISSARAALQGRTRLSSGAQVMNTGCGCMKLLHTASFFLACATATRLFLPNGDIDIVVITAPQYAPTKPTSKSDASDSTASRSRRDSNRSSAGMSRCELQRSSWWFAP